MFRVSLAATLVFQYLTDRGLETAQYAALTQKLTEGPLAYLCLVLEVVLAMLPHFVCQFYGANYRAGPADLVRQQVHPSPRPQQGAELSPQQGGRMGWEHVQHHIGLHRCLTRASCWQQTMQ